jgi:signal transduction histidine kinase
MLQAGHMKQATLDLLDLADAGLYQEEFLTLVSHEFRTPLTALKLQAQAYKRLMSRKGEMDPKRLEKLMDEFEVQTSKMSGLIDLFLELSSWRLRKWNHKYEDFSFNELILEVAPMIYSQEHIHPNISFKGDRKKLLFAFKILFKELERFGIIEMRCKNLKKNIGLVFKLSSFDPLMFQHSSSLSPGVSLGPFLHEKSPLELALDIFHYHDSRIETKKMNDTYMFSLKLKKLE